MRPFIRLDRIFIVILAGLGAALPLEAQFRPEEIAQREQWEIFLVSADIIKFEPLGEGVTHPWKLTLGLNGVEKKAVWKDIDTSRDGFPDCWRYEIAAYRLDKLLGLNMVPPVVEREFRGDQGDLSLWADNKYSLLKVMEQNVAVPESARTSIDDRKYLSRAWDSLIANDDRTQQNVLYTEDWRTILIDHTRAFRSDRAHRRQLIYGANGIKTMDDGRGGQRPVLFRRLPRTFVDKLRGLDRTAVERAVGPYLKAVEIDALFARRILLLDEIEGMIKRDGENAVLYKP
jgi:hypothetical protein